MGEGVLPKDDDLPNFVTLIQLAQAFGVHPNVFEDYEPSDIDFMTLYLAAFSEGSENKRKRQAEQARRR